MDRMVADLSADAVMACLTNYRPANKRQPALKIQLSKFSAGPVETPVENASEFCS